MKFSETDESVHNYAERLSDYDLLDWAESIIEAESKGQALACMTEMARRYRLLLEQGTKE